MIDTWSTVFGKRVHISGGVGIGGVLSCCRPSPSSSRTTPSSARAGGSGGRRAQGRGAGDGRVPRRHQDRRPRNRRDFLSARFRNIRWWFPAPCPASPYRTASPARPLRRDHEARRRVHPLQDQHQRAAAGLGSNPGLSRATNSRVGGDPMAARSLWYELDLVSLPLRRPHARALLWQVLPIVLRSLLGTDDQAIHVLNGQRSFTSSLSFDFALDDLFKVVDPLGPSSAAVRRPPDHFQGVRTAASASSDELPDFKVLAIVLVMKTSWAVGVR